MRKMKFFKVLMFMVVALSTPNALADSFRSVDLAKDRDLSVELQSIVRTFDASAIVFARGEKITKTERIRPPGVPFVLEDVSSDVLHQSTAKKQSGESNSSKGRYYSNLEVTVFSTSGNLPKSVVTVVKRVAETYADKVDIVFDRLPRDLLIVPENRENKSDSPAAPTANKTWEPIFSETLTKFQKALDDIRNVYSELGQQGHTLKSMTMFFLVSLAGLLIAVSVAFILMQRRLQILIRNGLADVVSSLETSGRTMNISTSPSVRLSQQNTVRDSSSKSDFGELNALSDDALLALISDCYWTNQDDYGSFLWRHIHPDKKLLIIKRMPEIANYARFLLNQPEVNLGLDQDPAYLRPLALWHMDMSDVTELVRRQPIILKRLSPLRLVALDLSPKERISIYTSVNVENDDSLPNIPSTASPLRPLQQSMTIRVRSIQDEIEVLEMRELSTATISDVPSLGWIRRLPERSAIEFLKTISVRELAAAWVGPVEVLDYIAGRLGDKKLALLKSTLEQVAPSRDSVEFYRIHLGIVNELQKLELQKAERPADEERSMKQREFLNAG